MNIIDINRFTNIEAFKLLNADKDEWAMRTLAIMGCVLADESKRPFLPLQYTKKGVELRQRLKSKKWIFDFLFLISATIILSQFLPVIAVALISLGLKEVFYLFLKRKYLKKGIINNCYRYF